MDEGRDEILNETDDVTDEDDDVVDDVDELGDEGESEPSTPTSFATKDINENDLDPTAGASDIGGIAGGNDDADAAGKEGGG